MKFTPYIVLFLFISLASCFQEKEIFLPNNRVDDPAFLVRQNLVKRQQFAFSIDEHAVLLSSKSNSIFRIPAGSLLHEDGSVFKGNATMEITETNRIGDFILLGKSPVTQKNMLQAQWLLNIKFLSQGNTLYINPQLPVEWITHVNEKEEFSSLYKEVTSESNAKTWVLLSNLSLQNWVFEEENETLQGTGCISSIEESGWYLMAKPFFSDPETSEQVCIEIPNGYVANNSVLFAIETSKNLMIPINLEGESNIHCSGEYKFPENSGIKFVLISYREDGEYYFGEAEYQTGSPHTSGIEPNALSIESIAQIVQRY